MNYLRYLMIGFLLFSNGVTAETEEGIAIDALAKKFYEIMHSKADDKTKEQKILELDDYKYKIESQLEKSPNNPQLWWLSGLNILTYKYLIEKEELYKDDKKRWKEITTKKI